MKLLIGMAAISLSLLSFNAQPPPESPSETPPPGPGATPGPVAVSPAVAEVLRLVQSGVGEDVVLAYIQNSAGGFDLSPEQILYVRDVGLSSQEITAMLNRDSAVRSQPPSAPPAAEPPPAPAHEPTVPVEAPLTPLPTESTAPPQQVNYFYSDLAPYGTWAVLPGIGWCWQPTVVAVNHGWQPYCDRGHWLYCNSGWYWQSEYSWGWAPFHYGRWQLHPRCGWVWAPDAVWGPAWVTWRTVGNSCGWAPLPPTAVFATGVGWRYNGVAVGASFGFGLGASSFTFVSLNNFNERNLGPHRLPPTEVTKIYNQTTIINNYTVNNTTVINHGIPVERVSAVAATPVHRAVIRETTVGSTKTLTTTQPAGKGETVVYRSQLRTPTRSAPVVVQKVDDRHPVIHHTPSVQVSAPRTATYGSGGPRTSGASSGVRQAPTQPGIASSRSTYSTPSQQTPRAPQSAPLTPSAPNRPASSATTQPAPQPSQSAPLTPTRQPPNQRYTEAQPDSRNVDSGSRSYQSETPQASPPLYSPKGHEQQSRGMRQSAGPGGQRQYSPSQSQSGNSGGGKSKNSGS